MSELKKNSLPNGFFEELYRKSPDPWRFKTNPEEAAKYAATVAALPRSQYHSAFEIGCSIGILTAHLAKYCQNLLAVDVVEQALKSASAHCIDLPQVKFAQMRVPEQYPDEIFDLTLLSEVGYNWSYQDLFIARQKIVEHLAPGGHLLLVHCILDLPKYPLTGDEVHEVFLQDDRLQHVKGNRAEKYRIDLFEAK